MAQTPPFLSSLLWSLTLRDVRGRLAVVSLLDQKHIILRKKHMSSDSFVKRIDKIRSIFNEKTQKIKMITAIIFDK